MSMNSGEEVSFSCRRLSFPPVCLGGGNERPHPDLVDLPRAQTLPMGTKATKKKLTKHIKEDVLKDIVYQMYCGEFVAKVTYSRMDYEEQGEERTQEGLMGVFGVSSPDGQGDSPYHSEDLIGQSFTSLETEDTTYCRGDRKDFNLDFCERLGSEHKGYFLLCMWHQLLRQHASSFSSRALIVALQNLLTTYVSKGMLELLVDAVVIAADSVLARNDMEVDMKFSNSFVKAGEYLESQAMFAAAAAIYKVASTPLDEPRQLATMNSFIGLAHRRNRRFDLSEAYYITALMYHAIDHGNSLNFDDDDTQEVFHKLLAMYSHLCVSGEDQVVQQAVIAILLTGGYRTRVYCFHNHKKFLKKEYRKPAKARQLFSHAVLSGNTRDFRRICLAAKVLGVTVNSSTNGLGTIEQNRQIAMQSASHDFQSGNFQGTVLFSYCAYCKEAHKEDGSCKLMSCPCKAVAYCTKECQVAHWPEHKKLCAHNLKRKKGG